MVIHRAALHDCLLESLDVDTRLGTTVTALEERPDGVTCHLDDESAGVADVVIGADGVGSRVRALLLGTGAWTSCATTSSNSTAWCSEAATSH